MTGSSIAAAHGARGAYASAGSAHVPFALMALAAFALYWASSFHLDATHRTTHFAADTWFYAELAKGDVLGRISGSYFLDRIFRFHPTTVLMAAAWMEIVRPLSVWIAPEHLLKALFALVGAAGVWAGAWAFAAIVPRRQALLLGAIYACSLSVWYFSSIEESKIVGATLSALYIAVYLHMRQTWTLRRAALLTTILLLACLNEIVAGFLVVIPLVDSAVQRGLAPRHLRWIGTHALAAPVALAILEGLMRGRISAAGYHPEGATHFSMLLYYIAQNNYSLWGLHAFVVKWLFFSIAAPSRDASYLADANVNYGGDFEPLAMHYFSSPASAALVILFAALLAASLLPRYRGQALGGLVGVFAGLAGFALLRGVFFLVFLPYECILFSSPVVLAHLMLVGVPMAVSRVPAKQGLLAALAALLFLTNGAFIAGP
ncbi:MAG: hypothetical protein J2P50_02640 [Hyphomicrobiaceae bacterium]|nr:hypothetical protein [Hyphomicrobiaceae bacterium]